MPVITPIVVTPGSGGAISFFHFPGPGFPGEAVREVRLTPSLGQWAASHRIASENVLLLAPSFPSTHPPVFPLSLFVRAHLHGCEMLMARCTVLNTCTPQRHSCHSLKITGGWLYINSLY